MEVKVGTLQYPDTDDTVFGVFADGKLVFMIGRTTCTQATASLIVALLDNAQHILKAGHYFAAEHASNIFPVA